MHTPYEAAKRQFGHKVTASVRESFGMGDTPTELMGNFLGYYHQQDPTTFGKDNLLTYPSVNCFIPYRDKIVPRLGTTLLGEGYSQDWGIVGHMKKYGTASGIELEIRVVKSVGSNKRDIIEVLVPNFIAGVQQNIYSWKQITLDNNPLAAGEHEYYFAQWFDANINLAKSLNLSRAIWVNGNKAIYSWTGGIAPVVSFVANTSITTTSGKTWAQLGFVNPALDSTLSGTITINGIAYTVTGGWATDTLTVTSTAGISVNDIAFSEIQTNIPPIAFDVCANSNGYMYYGAWDSMQLFQSNQFAKDSLINITNVQAVQNDLVIGTSQYTGTGQHVYRVTIDSVNPEIEEQQFYSTTPNGLNDARFDTSGYSLSNGITNVYKVLVVADFSIVIPDVTGFIKGEVVRGSVSNAEAIFIGSVPNGGSDQMAVKMLSGSFEVGENIEGLQSLTSEVAQLVLYQNWVEYYKNGVQTNATSGPVTGKLVPLFDSPPDTVNLTNGLDIVFGNYFNHQIGDYWELTINKGGHDTFQWQIDGGTPVATGVAITGGVQTLSNGVTITFVSKTGHTLGDFWDLTATQAVGGITPTSGNQQAFANFYYTLPIRAPGEGYIYQLPANFWAMASQENSLYVCNNYGNWSYVTTQLAGDLMSETISITPLKQTGSSKPIYPYMIGHLDNDLIYVTNNKTLDMIGRLELIELPRISTLSHPVQLDFNAVTFTGGSIEYWDKRLWITSPKEVVMFCYDNHPENLYWQPPQMIPENAILSVITRNGIDYLISHSQLRNQSWTLFNGHDGDNGIEYLVQARTPYISKGTHWTEKSANSTFCEGYVEGNPPMVQKLLKGIQGCGGIVEHKVLPVVCIPLSQAPFGMGVFGSHPNGSDIFDPNNYFQEVYPYQQTQNFYLAAIEMSCRTTNHTYEWLSFGINAVMGVSGNVNLKNKTTILKN